MVLVCFCRHRPHLLFTARISLQLAACEVSVPPVRFSPAASSSDMVFCWLLVFTAPPGVGTSRKMFGEARSRVTET